MHDVKKITILDIIITTLVLLLVIFIIYYKFSSKSNSSILLVQSPEGEFYYSLNQQKTIQITGAHGIVIIEIDQGKFCFRESNCKTQLCVNYGWVSVPDYPVICLPNRVSAYITGKTEQNNQYDGVSW